MRLFYLLALFFFATANLQSQSNGSIKKYLDDGGIASSKSLFKLDLTKIYEGNLALSYERRMSNHFALELGAGLIMGFYKDPIFYDLVTKPSKEDFTLHKPKMGFSLSLNPKYYLSEWSESFYCSVPISYRLYPGQIHLIDLSANWGMQWIFDSGLLIDISAGLGITLQSSIDSKSYIFDASSRISYDYEGGNVAPGVDLGLEDSYPSKLRMLIPINIKVGYRF